MKNLTYLNNSVNINIINVQNIQISDSQFNNNTGINGGALFIENNFIKFNVSNSTFQGNVAKASGGAIYFKEQQGIINIDKFCSIKQNHAQIGGGFRIQNSNLYQYSTQLLSQVRLLDIHNNTADIFGQNYNLGLSSIDVISITSVIQDNSPIKYKFKQNLNQEMYSGQLNLFNLKSGDKLNIVLGIKDEEKNFLAFETKIFQNNQYQTEIQNELSQISFSLQQIDQQQIQLEGQIAILSDSFDSQTKSFAFTQVSIMGQPLGVGQLKLNYQINKFEQKPIIVSVQFRNCIIGEEFKHLIFSIYSCQYCQIGSYSLVNYDSYNITYINSQNIQSSCKQCPKIADQCQGSTIQLKNGHWRVSKHSDQIIQCVNNPISCQESDISSINGCIKGYLGPLCEECDIFGVFWQESSDPFNIEQNISFLSEKIPYLHNVKCKNSNSAEQDTNNCINIYSQSFASKNIINQKNSDFQDIKKEVESLESISTIYEKLNSKGYMKQLSDFLDHLILEELNFTYAELQKIMMNLANQKNLNFNEQFQINCNIFKTCFFQIINIIVQKSWQKQYGALQQTSIPSIQQIHDKIENASINESQKNENRGVLSLENEKLNQIKEQQIIQNNQKLDQYQIYKVSNLSQLYKSDQLEQIMSVGAISSEESVYQMSQQKIQIDPSKESHLYTPSNTTNATAYENTSECKDTRRRTKSSINPKEYLRQLAKSDQKLSLLLNINEYDKTHMFKKILEKHKQSLIYSPKQQQTVRNSVMRSSFFSPSHSCNKKEDLFIINLSEFAQNNTKLKQSFSISERRSNVNQIKQTPSPCDYDVKKSEKFVRPNSPTQAFSKSPRQSWIDLQTKKEGVYQIYTQKKNDTKRSNLSVKKITSNSGVK
ncbi:transmembrane protein, putative (macronuclear) [Tetrahymena thermophila SB210]|uniref:Transmembrane protein, putative n=1 Tax=Tetrahymena thermophila (strain SB210) TaxID=312017 RepID=I7M8I9_TETTS|nr:transmembrane protein, putative [Tetrahymena thermophila SB210]EAR98265.2 transmembrane protein, putative [Tetrahymena thermophila SB210]|eukprot:XP_001018510.2 transmembrane protein, putative [Tetrahymena thermophila SB210]